MLSRIVTLCLVVSLVRSEAVLKNNGYEDVVVVIGEQVPEDIRIIENIKRMFEDGSRVLDTATHHRAHFRNITIVVPPSWTPQPQYKREVGVGRAARAAIHVDLPHPRHRNTPYTLQLGGCGHPGQYIHLSPEYTTNMYDELGQAYGPPGKVLVHEWAHLRWGVFDEYPTPHTHSRTHSPPFYVGDDSMVHATGCSANIVGWARTKDGTLCRADQSGLPDAQCHFYPAHNNTVQASLMGLYHLQSVQFFCDNDGVAHNPLAPTPHNLLCGGRSVWEVIRQHPDFYDDKNLPRKKRERDEANARKEEEEELMPEFLVVQQRMKRKIGAVVNGEKVEENVEEETLRFILLLDLSASMESYIDQLYQAVVGFVRYLAPAGSKMAVVSFSNTTHVDLPFTLVPEGRRENLVARLPSTYVENGYTAIGSAVKLALELLEIDGVGGGTVVLVTDGEETVLPLVSTILPSLKAARLPLNTIAFGPYATDSLEVWAEETGGRSYYHSPESGGAGPGGSLDTQLFEAVSHILPFHTQRLVQVYRKTHVVGRKLGQWVKGQVVLDSSLGHTTHLTFTQAFSPNTKFSVGVEVDGADGVHYGNWSDSETYHADPTTRIIAFSIPLAEAGVWRYTITRNKKDLVKAEVRVVVTSYPRSHTPQPPVRVDAGLVLGGNSSYPTPALVVATVTRGRSPVLDANATALVVPPPSNTTAAASPTTITLKDDGLIGDREASDGVYSGYFTQFSGNGRYSFSVTVSATNHTAALGDSQPPSLPSSSHPSPAAQDTTSHSPSTPSSLSHSPSIPSSPHLQYSSGSSAIQSLPLPLSENSLPPPLSAFNPKYLKPHVEAEDGDEGQGEGGDQDGETDEKIKPKDPGVRTTNGINKIEPFTRVVSGGIFKVHNYKAGDQQPPGRVEDLKADVDMRKSTITLSFTSTGDDLYTGTASSLEVRYHHTSVLARDFSRGHQVEQHYLISGDLIPRPAMAPHTLTLKVPGIDTLSDREGTGGRVVFFMLRARDECGNIGDPSNLATAYFPPRSYIKKVETKEELEALSGLVVLVVLAVVILALVIFTCSLKRLHSRRKRKRREQDLLEGGGGAMASGATLRSGRGTLRGSGSGAHRGSVVSGTQRGSVVSGTLRGAGNVGYQYYN